MRLVLAACAVVAAFLALNYRAYDGYFQDDEFDNLTWAPTLPAMSYVHSLVSPAFERDNFRPTGHLYFALMGRAFGLDFPPYITPIFAIHFLNAALVFLLSRRLSAKIWQALGATAFFTLSAAAIDAYWKPMYVFDLLCTTFCLASVLAWAHRRWILSFLAYWLAYKAKEMAVMLPLVLLLYEFWFGEKKYLRVVPFLLASLSFGLQGILLNPNKGSSPYAFHFSRNALERTLPYYAQRFLLFPASGAMLIALAFIRDKRIWLALSAMILLMVPLLFLPDRLFNAYAYLPLAWASIAIAVAASRVRPVWIWLALALWLPFNARALRHQRNEILAGDDQNFGFANGILEWSRAHPQPDLFVFDGRPANFHDWGTAAVWRLAHKPDTQAPLFLATPAAREAMAREPVALGHWDYRTNILSMSVQAPSRE